MTDPITQAERENLRTMHPDEWVHRLLAALEAAEERLRSMDLLLGNAERVVLDVQSERDVIRAARDKIQVQLNHATTRQCYLDMRAAHERETVALARVVELVDERDTLRADRDALKSEIDMAQGEAEHAVGGPRESLLAAVRDLCADLADAKAERKEVQGILNASVDACGLELLMSLPGAITRLRADLALAKAKLDEREGDMHLRIRAGYDQTVADSWKREVAKVEAERDALKAERDRLRSAHAESNLQWAADLARVVAERDSATRMLHDACCEQFQRLRAEVERASKGGAS